MKRVLILVATALTVGLVGWTGVAHAGSIRTGQKTEVKAGEVVDSSLFAAGSRITIAGTVKGDVFCAGQRVEITGTVEGDVLCAAQLLTLKGTVQGDVRIAAMNLTDDAMVAGSATLAGQLITINKTATVGRDLTLGGADVTVNGSVGRDLLGGAENFTLDGIVGRHLRLHETTLSTLDEHAVVKGDFIYTSETDAAIADGAKVSGKTERLAPPAPEKRDHSSAVAEYISGATFMFLSMFVVALAILGLAPKVMDGAERVMRQRHIWTFGIGLTVLGFMPIVALILLVTVVGIPLAIILMLSWLVLLMTAVSFTAYTLGQIMSAKLQWNSRWPHLSSLALGFLALFIVGLIPFVNILMLLCAVVWGAGGVIIAVLEQGRKMPPAKAGGAGKAAGETSKKE